MNVLSLLLAGRKKAQRKNKEEVLSWAKTDKPEASRAGEWDFLCNDVKRTILSKLPLPALARAATVCKELRDAYVERVEKERAGLIAAGEKPFGKEMFSTLVTALQRSMCGLGPCPHAQCESPVRDTVRGHFHLISNAATRPTLVRLETAGSVPYVKGPYGFIEKKFHLRSGFDARLYQDDGWVAGSRLGRPYARLKLRLRSEGGKLDVWVNMEALTPVLGLLLAVFSPKIDALPASFPTALRIFFHVGEANSIKEVVGKVTDFMKQCLINAAREECPPDLKMWVRREKLPFGF
jgi:hypothetical protein